MPVTIDQRLLRVLIELAECKDLPPKDRLDAARQLAEIKANKPKRAVKGKQQARTSLLGD